MEAINTTKANVEFSEYKFMQDIGDKHTRDLSHSVDRIVHYGLVCICIVVYRDCENR